MECWREERDRKLRLIKLNLEENRFIPWISVSVKLARKDNYRDDGKIKSAIPVDKHGLSHYFTLEESTWKSFFFFGLPNPADYSFLPEEKEGGGEDTLTSAHSLE